MDDGTYVFELTLLTVAEGRPQECSGCSSAASIRVRQRVRLRSSHIREEASGRRWVGSELTMQQSIT